MTRMLRRLPAVALLIALIGIVPVLSGCEDFDLDKLDVFNLNKKKPLPGKRVELFPNGVPGVSKGIPPQYMEGYQPPPDSEALPPGENGQKTVVGGPGAQKVAASQRKTAAVTPAEPMQLEPKPKRQPKPTHKAKRKSKPTHKAKHKPKPKPKPAPHPASQPQNQLPWPTSNKPTAPWPTDKQPQKGSNAPWPSATDTTQPWPSAPPPGTFSK